MNVIEKIKSFTELQVGWSFGEGKPIQPDVIEAAIEFAERSARNARLEMDAFPGLCGEVMVTIYRQEEYWEFILHEDGKVAYAHEVEDELLDYRENLIGRFSRDASNRFSSDMG